MVDSMMIRRPLKVALGLFIALLHIPLTTLAAVQTNSKIMQPEEREEQKNVRVLPFFAPTYSPEMRVVFNTGVLLSFKADPDDPDLQRSSIPFAIGVGTTGSVRSSSLLTTFWLNDMIRFNANLWLKIMPDNYYGVGYEAGRYTKKGELTTAYDRVWWQINPKVYVRVYPHLYTGLNLDFNQTVAKNVSPGMASDPYFQRYGPDNYNGGAGPILMYDSRDMMVNAYRGMYLYGGATFYGGYLGSDNIYQIFDVDYRQYRTIGRPGRRIAWQVRSRIGVGNVPWAEMSQPGTPWDLRGYHWGQYRHNTMLLGIVEYRHKFMRSKNTPNTFGKHESRHGAAAWAGIGSIGMDLFHLKHPLPNVGVGYRFEVQPRMNLRVDIGFGLDSVGFYIEINEAY
jgi:hypothetical protein